MMTYFDSLFRRAERRRVLSDLLSFDDHMLRDIGLTRSEIATYRSRGQKPARFDHE